MTAYLVDASVFIQAKNLHYGFDLHPVVLDWMMEGSRVGTVASMERVVDELYAGGHEPSDWATVWGNGFFHRLDNAAMPALGIVGDW